jgi:uncharacterized membrane protein HdeD (DUF308 family)
MTTTASSGMVSDQEVLESAASKWWLFLLGGIAWLIVSLVLFRFDYTSVHTVSILFGIVAIVAGVWEFFAIGVSTTGWKIVHAILGLIFIAVGIVAFVHPGNTFRALAAVIGFWFLFKGIFDFVAAFASREVFGLWWTQLVAGIIELLIAILCAQGDLADKAVLLILYVGIMCLSKGVTELILAFKLRSAGRQLKLA